MAVQFVVETGAGIEGANSFCTVAFADQYHENMGSSATWTGTEAIKQSALIVATRYLNSAYQYIGEPFVWLPGHLAWPRWWAYDEEGVLYDGVPVLMQEATAWLAARHLVKPIDEPVDLSKDLKSLSIAGSVSLEWNEGAGASAQRRFAFLENLLSRLVLSGGLGGGTYGMGQVIRG